jgi:hypothetical membrane protein
MKRLAWGAVAAQIIFVGGWLILGAIEGHGYSAIRHEISDLGALTAHHAGAARATLLISGALTAAFALGVVRPAFGLLPGVLLALSVPSLDNMGDFFFRLDCRAADPGCTTSEALSSWHGTMHVVVFLVALIPTLIVPFVLARRGVAGAKAFGFVANALFVLSGVTQGTAIMGLTQRISAVVITGAIAVLAVRLGLDAVELGVQPAKRHELVVGAGFDHA